MVRKLLPVLLFLLVFLFLTPKKVFAGCEMQRADVNSFLKCQQAAPGSTFSFLYYPGDNSTLNQIVAANNSLPKPVNLDIRLYSYGGLPSQAEINDFLVSLGSSGSKTKINARLNNEVNNLANENIRNQLSVSDVGKYQFTTYYNAFQFLKQAGLTDNVSLGIALDHLAPDWQDKGLVSIETTVAQMRAAAAAQGVDFNQWLKSSGITWLMNGYVYTNDPTHYKEGLTIAQVLDRLGLPKDIRYAFFEAGANQPGHVSYDPNDLVIVLKSLAAQMAAMRGTYNFDWINVLTVNPDPKGANTDFNLLDHPDLIALLLDNRAAINATPEDIAKLEQLLKDLGYIHCPNGGIAKTLEECTRSFPPLATRPPHPENVCTAPGGVSPSTFRPAPCENCGYDPVSPAGGYATTATIFASFRIPVNSLPPPDNLTCGGDILVVKDWSGTFSIDTSKNRVPFVGFGESDKMINEVDKPLLRYLSDYFDGTALYDGNGAGSDPTDPNSMLDMTNRSGVLRKLMPQELQDQTRRRVLSGQANPGDPIPIGKYTLKTKLDNSQNNEALTANMSDFTGDRIKPLRSDFPMTEDGYAQYKDKLDKWFKLPGGPNNTPGYWAALWSVIPLTTRQDIPGEFDLSIEGPPGQINGAKDSDPPTFQAAFPHLGRLFELLSIVSNIFTPGNNTKQILGQYINESKGTVAGVKTSNKSRLSQNGQVLGQDTEACQFSTTIQPILTGGGGNYHSCFRIQSNYLGPNLPPEGSWGTDWGYNFNISVNGKIVASTYKSQGSGRYIYSPSGQWDNCQDGPLDFSAPANSQVTYGVSFVGGHFDTTGRNRDCLGEVMDGVYASLLDCKIGADGKPDLTTCTTNGPVPPTAEVPVCGNKIFYTPPDVSDRGMLDEINGEKLDIVCTNPNPITARVTVKGDKIRIPYQEVRDALAEQARTGEVQYVIARTSRKIGIGVQIPYLDQIWGMLQTILRTREPNPTVDSLVAKVSNADVPAKVPVSYSFAIDPAPGVSGGVQGPGSAPVSPPDNSKSIGGNSSLVLAVIDESNPGPSKPVGTGTTGTTPTGPADQVSGGSTNEGFIYYPHLGTAACAKVYILKTVWPQGTSDPLIDRVWEDCKGQVSGLQ